MTDLDRQEREALIEAEQELRRISTIVDDEDAGLLQATAERVKEALAISEGGHSLDRISFLSGYYQGANLLTAAIKPGSIRAVEEFANYAWKATGTEREPKR
jgi:hypothetical protein